MPKKHFSTLSFWPNVVKDTIYDVIHLLFPYLKSVIFEPFTILT